MVLIGKTPRRSTSLSEAAIAQLHEASSTRASAIKGRLKGIAQLRCNAAICLYLLLGNQSAHRAGLAHRASEQRIHRAHGMGYVLTAAGQEPGF